MKSEFDTQCCNIQPLEVLIPLHFNTSSFYDKIVAICGKTQMLNDVKKLSPEVHTSHLEAFHSTLNQFHPKMTAYSYTGTYCRLYIVILYIFLQYTICFFSFSTQRMLIAFSKTIEL